MKTRRLGTTELVISRIGLGSWAFGGGDWDFGWGPSSDEASVETIRRALSLGVNWIDTAPIYGLGRAEEVVGRAIRELLQSERPLVFTKCGLVWTEGGKLRHRLQRDSIRGEVEASLGRLGLDTIDLYQIHWPTFPPGSPAEHIEEGWETLVRLRDEGKVRYIGVSNFDIPQLERLLPRGSVASLQPPYSLVHRGLESDMLPYCLEREIGVLTYSPLASGLLSGRMTRERIEALPENDWRKSKSLDFRDPALTRHLETARRVVDVAEALGSSAPAVAIGWVLRHAAVTGVIAGARTSGQIDAIVDADDLRLSDAQVSALTAENGSGAS